MREELKSLMHDVVEVTILFLVGTTFGVGMVGIGYHLLDVPLWVINVYFAIIVLTACIARLFKREKP